MFNKVLARIDNSLVNSIERNVGESYSQAKPDSELLYLNALTNAFKIS